MAGSHDSVEVLHLVGADDAFIAREFQGRFLRLGLEGGAIGGVAALVVTILIGWAAAGLAAGPGSDQLAALFGSFELGWFGHLIVLLIALAVALIAGLVSRASPSAGIWSASREAACSAFGDHSVMGWPCPDSAATFSRRIHPARSQRCR